MPWTEKINTKWVSDGINNDTIQWCQKFGHDLAKTEKEKQKDRYGNEKEISISPMTTSQIRKFFGEIKRIQAEGADKDFLKNIILLKPKLAYAVGRSNKSQYDKNKIEYFYKEISDAIDAIKTKEQFKNFVQIVEAIVAYHKEKGGQ